MVKMNGLSSTLIYTRLVLPMPLNTYCITIINVSFGGKKHSIPNTIVPNFTLCCVLSNFPLNFF
jgi:hypothetical protein